MLPSTIVTTDLHSGGEPFRSVAEHPVGTVRRHDSIAGSTFTSIVLDTVEVGGRAAVVPQVTGMAYRTGEHTFSIDAHDPLLPGFVLR